MDATVKERLALNESFFRAINERIEAGQWPGEQDMATAFRCECARLGCNMLLSVTPAHYEKVRSNPRRFLLAYGHEIPEVEVIVERAAGYVVVEKQGLAGAVADDAVPRS
jgi:hypothetical protein